jgi:hypothetical protein
MDISPRHRDAEERFRRLIEDAGIDAPDAVSYEADSVTFYWTDTKLAVIVDLDDAEAPVVVNGRSPRESGSADA